MQTELLLRQQLVRLMTTSEAHADYDKAVSEMPTDLQGKTPEGAEHSPWQILEHLRITLWDILEFSRDPSHQSPQWPEGYWPESATPPDGAAWNLSVEVFHKDLKAMCDLVEDSSTDLYAPIPGGDGQTVLREALLVADHNAYHVGQLVLVRRQLGAWK